jgi:glycosyltransferase involved in cell wall biosynthesis
VLFERQSASNREPTWPSNRETNFKAEYLIGKKVGADSALCVGVSKWLHRGLFDIFIVGGYGTPTGMLAVEIFRLRKIPFILNADGGIIKEDNKLKFILKKHFIKAAKHYLSSGKMTSEYLKYYGASSKEIYEYPFSSLLQSDILENFLPHQEKNTYKKQLNINEKKMILSVGQFIYRKSFDVLLEACSKLSRGYSVYIIGGEPTKEYLDLKEKYGLENVHFVGFKSKCELSEYYKAADLFVLPTREDIWGLVINEAMAFGLPVITTDRCIAGLELIKDYENGFIVPVERADILAKRIEEVLSDEQLAIRMGKTSLKKIRPYTIENMARQHFNIFKKILDI